MECMSRAEAKRKGLKFYYEGKSCKNGHASVRLVSNYGCYDCHKKRYYTYIQTEEGKELRKKQAKKDYHANKDRYFFNNAKRRALCKQATPAWLSEKYINEIKDMYKNRPEGYHVDHIVPLNGSNVCGLNVPWNLQYLIACDNLSKSNK